MEVMYVRSPIYARCSPAKAVVHVTAEDIERQANPRREKAGAIFFGEPCKAIAALPAAFRASEPNKPFD
jgi:hypothetical protein